MRIIHTPITEIVVVAESVTRVVVLDCAITRKTLGTFD